MGRKHRDIDEYVRRAVPIGDEELARLVDPHTRQDLLDQILSQPVPGETAAPARIGRSRRTRLALAGAAAGTLLAGSLGAVTAVDGFGSADADRSPVAPAATDAGSSVPLVGGPAGRCAEGYDAHTVTRRTFAFDGTVIEIVELAPSGEEGLIEFLVTFRIEEWFRGGETEQFTVTMHPPMQESSSDDSLGFDLRSWLGWRLLVSGDDRSGSKRLDHPEAWYCGFTRTYSADTAAEWRRSFSAACLAPGRP
jgi:hypothetical protein